MNNSQIARAFARGSTDIYSSTALSVRKGFLFSYAEPIAVLRGARMLVTTAHFSVTTSKHRSGAIRAATGTVGDIEHGELRRMAREAGLTIGSRGESYDA